MVANASIRCDGNFNNRMQVCAYSVLHTLVTRKREKLGD